MFERISKSLYCVLAGALINALRQLHITVFGKVNGHEPNADNLISYPSNSHPLSFEKKFTGNILKKRGTIGQLLRRRIASWNTGHFLPISVQYEFTRGRSWVCQPHRSFTHNPESNSVSSVKGHCYTRKQGGRHECLPLKKMKNVTSERIFSELPEVKCNI